MAIQGIEQPEVIQIDGSLRLRKYDGVHDFALEWYRDPDTVWLVDGDRIPYTPELLTKMYTWLDNAGELYFIEVLEHGIYRPIGDVTFWQEDMPIVIGDPNCRRRGLGRKIITALINRGRELGYDHLCVEEIYDWNEGSRRCFESVGFTACGKTEKGASYRLDLKGSKRMIRTIKSYDECRDFASRLKDDPQFSHPMLVNEERIRNNLVKAIENPEEYCVLGIYRGEEMTGLFVFLVIRDEQYMEMIAGLSRDRCAYGEVFQYLEQNYSGYSGDFVFNPGNYLLKELLEAKGAEFEKEQQKMVFRAPVLAADTTGVELLSEKYTGQYCDIHNKDMYWTGEKVAAAQDRFRTLLAIQEGKVVGYLDVTFTFDENEPFDLFVLEEYRRMGYGRKLLAKALEMNRPKGMWLLVDVDNDPAIRLYESMGFEKVPGQNSLTAHWAVPGTEQK